MKEIKVLPCQTIYDIAVMYYGTCQAVGEILSNNPEISNEDAFKVALGIDSARDKEFYPDLPVKSGSTILIDTDSRLIKKNIVREIEKEVTTFDLKKYGADNQ